MAAPARRLAAALAAAFAFAFAASAATIHATDERTIAAALPNLRAGDTLTIAPGTYAGNLSVTGLTGSATAPVTIAGSDPAAPPVFQAGNGALRLSSCAYVKLRNLRVLGLPASGIVVDDGDARDTPSHHILIESISMNETGLRDQRGALRLDGVEDVIVRNCNFEAWGGAALTITRSRRVFVTDCRFIGRERTSQPEAVLIRGGSSNVLIQSSFFRWAGEHAINIGGDTNAVSAEPPCLPYEATAVEIAGNRIFGSFAPVAWINADGGHVHHNTLLFPHRWVIRILQRQTEPAAPPCRGGRFQFNVVLYDERVQHIVRSYDGTDPETFDFSSNVWHRTAGIKPLRLPAAAEGNLQQVDPQIALQGPTAFRASATDPRLQDRGADHHTPAPMPFSF